MNCRDFLSEFEERNVLGETATKHLRDCADCRKITVAQVHLWQVIDGFQTVDAPNDFDFRVRARIADAKPDSFRPHFLPILRYVLPLSLVIVILALIVVNGIYSIDDKSVPQIAQSTDKMPIQKSESSASITNEQIVAANTPQRLETGDAAANLIPKQINNRREPKAVVPETRLVAEKSVKKPVRVGNNDDKNFVGSQVSSQTQAQILTPKGFPQNQTTVNQSNFPTFSQVTVEQILSLLGIESVLEKGKRQVKKITANSVAERSKIQVGDIIEAIDGETLTDEPIRAKTIEGKKLIVTRGAEKLEILLRN